MLSEYDSYVNLLREPQQRLELRSVARPGIRILPFDAIAAEPNSFFAAGLRRNTQSHTRT